jgi:hypothetical protein
MVLAEPDLQMSGKQDIIHEEEAAEAAMNNMSQMRW